MQFNSQSIKKRFEKSMDKYNENAVVQTCLAEKLSTELSRICNNFDVILEQGCGTGILTAQLKNKVEFKTYYANDIVDKSKNYITKILPDMKFIHGNALKIKLPQKADLIISNAMIQWFADFSKIKSYCYQNLNNNGIWAFSTFGTENFKEIRELSGLSLNYLTQNELVEQLKSDFKILYTEEYTETLKFDNPLALLAHMKNTGVNSLTSQNWTVKEVKEFCEKYLEKYGTVKLTYNPIIIIAQKIK